MGDVELLWNTLVDIFQSLKKDRVVLADLVCPISCVQNETTNVR